jgi:hypothetical protein
MEGYQFDSWISYSVSDFGSVSSECAGEMSIFLSSTGLSPFRFYDSEPFLNPFSFYNCTLGTCGFSSYALYYFIHLVYLLKHHICRSRETLRQRNAKSKHLILPFFMEIEKKERKLDTGDIPFSGRFF